MKRDTLNTSKRHASVIKISLLTILLTGGLSIVADDSKTPIVRLHKLGCCNKDEKTQLHAYSARIAKLFSDFFDEKNKHSFAVHKANFLATIHDLACYLKTAKVDKSSHKEIEHMIKELSAFITTLDSAAQPALKKGPNAGFTDIMPLALPLKPFSHLIPDTYFKSLSTFLSSILHRLRCTEQ